MRLWYYHIVIFLYYYIITILLYYFIIILIYYYIIILYYIMILLYYISILHHYWPFSNHGFCSNLASYQWSWIIKDCSKHRISARIFSILKKQPVFHNFFVFWPQGPWGPGPWSFLGPMGPPIFRIFWLFAKWSGTYIKVFLWCLEAQESP